MQPATRNPGATHPSPPSDWPSVPPATPVLCNPRPRQYATRNPGAMHPAAPSDTAASRGKHGVVDRLLELLLVEDHSTARAAQ
eukprot:358331-Chlamydomonas_euryale.AAC.9